MLHDAEICWGKVAEDVDVYFETESGIPLVFSREYETYRSLLEVDGKVLIKGRAQAQEEQNAKLICMEMHGFDEARKELWIQFPTKEAFEEQQQTLFSTIADMDGDDGIVVYISSIKAMKRMPANWNICVNEDSVGKISQIFGEQNVKVVEKNVEFQRKRY